VDSIEVVVGFLGCIVSNHLFGCALKAHALTAACAQHLVATVNLDHWHSAVAIGAFSDTIFNHIFVEVGISLANLNGLVAVESRVNDLLNKQIATLHLLQ
jgi:hypothetical protein